MPGSKTDLFAEATTAFPLYVPPKRSVYASLGDWWMAVLVAYVAGYLFWHRRRRRVREGGK